MCQLNTYLPGLAFHSLPFDRGGYLTYVAKCMTWQALAEYDVIKKIDDVRNELFRGHKYSIFIVQVSSCSGLMIEIV